MADTHDQSWYLEGRLPEEKVIRRFALREFPARVGRSTDLEIALPVAQVSSLHARIELQQGRLLLHDLGSSNGTFVNRERVTEPVELSIGDVLHFATAELLVGNELQDTGWLSDTTVMKASPREQATGTLSRARALRNLIEAGEVATALQPIVPLAVPGDLAFEILGRGARNELPPFPGPLFEIAEEAGLAGELSRCFRADGLEAFFNDTATTEIYTNVHPAELDEDALERNLAAFRERAPLQPITAEVHESTVTDPQAMRRLRACLADLNIGLAYDDFGAGQARLLELAECPPDCLKFDMSLIRDIDIAPASRQRLIESLVAWPRASSAPASWRPAAVSASSSGRASSSPIPPPSSTGRRPGPGCTRRKHPRRYSTARARRAARRPDGPPRGHPRQPVQARDLVTTASRR
jgi:EAL domain-containing protein (putative c-di-GMP-specific phosphodiesterase class I)